MRWFWALNDGPVGLAEGRFQALRPRNVSLVGSDGTDGNQHAIVILTHKAYSTADKVIYVDICNSK